MKVLLLSDANSTHTRKWVAGLVGMDIHIALFSLRAPDGDFYSQFSEEQLTLQSASIGRKSSALGKMAYLKAIPSVKKLIIDFAPDIVHAHYATSYGLLGAISGFKPYIISVWGSDVYDFPDKSLVHRFIITKILSSATRIASTSECMAKKVQDLLGPGTHVDVTPFGVDMSRFTPERKVSNSDQSPITIGTVKTMAHKYGIDTLIKAFAICRRELSSSPNSTTRKIRLHIVGDGPDLFNLIALAENQGISDVTTFSGSIFHEEVPENLAGMDVFVALSRLDSESFGVAIVEAGAMGIPVVVSDRGGLPEVVLDRKTGIVVPSDNPEAAAEAILELIENASLRSQLGQAARAHVAEHYSESHCNAVMFALYKAVINEGQ
jgi:glycosyltransferase involved in cell wall biosynthesis